MKKFYTLILAALLCCLTAQADGWDIVLNVSKGADKVKAVLGASETSDNIVKIVDGENKFSIPYYESLYITPLNEDDIVILKDCNGDIIEKSGYGYYEIYASEYRDNNTPYTLSVSDAADYRDKTVTVSMDDCTKVTVIRADGTEFDPAENSIEIPYNSEEEHIFTISPRSYDGMLYKVSAGGKDIEKTGRSFVVDLATTGDEGISYIDEVEVLANYPADLTFNTTITLDGPAEMISYIRINNTNVPDMAACLTGNGFDAKPGDVVAIGFDDNHKIESVVDNGEDKYAYSQYTIDGIDCDHKITIKGHKYATFTAKFNITGAEGFEASLGRTKIPFTDGENNPVFSEKNKYVTFSLVEGYYFSEFTDGTTDYLESSDYKYYGKIYLDMAEGQEYTIVAQKIRRDDSIVLYMDDFSNLEFSYFSVKFENYTPAEEIKAGYNTLNFRPEDGEFSVYASGSYDGFYAYKNGEAMDLSARYLEDSSVANGDVYKVFFVNDPGTHEVTFDVTGDALDGYAVKHDLIADTDCSAPVKAAGPTVFTISPVSRADKEIVVKVNDEEIKPVDGVFTFETKADTRVSVTAMSGIGDVITDTTGNADVYNLQGIRVASAADMSSLPAGIYIVNGKKTVIK